MNTILASKINQGQEFMLDGTRIPVTYLKAGPCVVVQTKNKKKDGYESIQLGFGVKKEKNINKPQSGHLKKSTEKSKLFPRFLREVPKEENDSFEIGDLIKVNQILKPGDIVNISGTSKGKGFTGVMKRWGFHGGPRTHGQSDRERAPGSIGQATYPGRVHKGKKMPGRSGGARVTIRNLLVVKVEENGTLCIKGQVPGAKNGLLIVKKVGEKKEFSGLFQGKQDKSKTKLDKKQEKDTKKPEKPKTSKKEKVTKGKDKKTEKKS